MCLRLIIYIYFAFLLVKILGDTEATMLGIWQQ